LIADKARISNAEVIHFHNISRELSATVLRATTLPKVMTLHDYRLLGAREHAVFKPHRAVEAFGASAVLRAARHRLVATIGVSDAVSAAARDAGFPEVTTVPVPVADPTGVLKPAASCRDVLVAARLAPDKGVDVVIDAFAAVAEHVPDSRLLIAGDGPSADKLRKRAADLGSRVEFLGWLDDLELSALMGRVRIVAVASMPGRRPEGSSLTAAEAAAHRRVVVGSDDAAVAEIVGALGAGPIVPAGDADALADALRALLSDDDAVTSYAEAAGVGAARHSIAAVTEATRAVYLKALEQGRGTRDA
jgi:glycosyltransferase involved in cell wall biosynthesis